MTLDLIINRRELYVYRPDNDVFIHGRLSTFLTSPRFRYAYRVTIIFQWHASDSDKDSDSALIAVRLHLASLDCQSTVLVYSEAYDDNRSSTSMSMNNNNVRCN